MITVLINIYIVNTNTIGGCDPRGMYKFPYVCGSNGKTYRLCDFQQDKLLRYPNLTISSFGTCEKPLHSRGDTLKENKPVDKYLVSADQKEMLFGNEKDENLLETVFILKNYNNA